MPLKLMYITNDPNIALVAEKNGVQRIWIDLEVLGKEERQKGLNTVKSHHTVEDIKIISSLLTTSEVLVRVNPWNENSIAEINSVIGAGAQIVMLPMWKNAGEVRNFVNAVEGRAKTNLLLETREAEACLEEVLNISGIDEIHIGLNDLHLSYGLTFMFELLSNGTVDRICKKLAAKGISYGFGGIAKIGQGLLPAEKIVMEHYRLGSTRAILSRSFCNTTNIIEAEQAFMQGIKELRTFENDIQKLSSGDFLENHYEIVELVNSILKQRNGRYVGE